MINVKQQEETNEYEKNLMKKVLNQDVNVIYDAVGCSECAKGYKSRIAIHEILVITEEIRDALANNLRKEDLRNLVYTSNVTTLLQDGLIKVLNGITTIEEVVKLIELDDDVDGKMNEYKYNLDKALMDVEIAKQNNDIDIEDLLINKNNDAEINDDIIIKKESVNNDIIFENDPLNLDVEIDKLKTNKNIIEDLF